MKSVFPYAVMVTLFLAGNRLADRQQKYNRLNSASAPAKSASLIGMFAKNTSDSQMKLVNTSKPSTEIGIARSVHKQGYSQ